MPDHGDFQLERFVAAQNPVFDQVLRELEAGRKQTHWMWFVFPQMKGLGSSPLAQRFAIGSRAEALAYLAYPVLGSRLLRCTRLANAAPAPTARAVFGTPDDLKFRSSMTLFHACAADQPEFRAALTKYFGGEGDPATLRLLAGG